jgi:hypothetical protein
MFNLKAALMAGSLAGLAYAVTAEIDNRISGQNLDDLKLLGRPLVKNPNKAKVAGIPVHMVNSVVLAGLFPVFRKVLPGPAIVQGVTYAVVENTVLYPVAAFENLHPGVRAGEIDRYFTLKAYLLSIPRHVAYGLTLGLLYDRFAKR